MTVALFVAGCLLLALPGAAVLRFRITADMDGLERYSLCFALGTFAAALVLYVMSLLGAGWSRAACGTLFALMGAVGFFLARGQRHSEWPRLSLPTVLAILILAMVTYAVLDARATCADLLYFWGPKGQAFFLARKIDPGFLRFPNHYLMHPDYPPLLPLLYAWASLTAHAMSWWGAVLLTPLFLFTSAAVFRGVARPVIGRELADRYALLFTAVIGLGLIAASAAGAAEPPLLLYETVALVVLSFGDAHENSNIIIAAIALAAAAFTKIEGAAFAAVAIAAFAVSRRRIGAALILAAFPSAILASWLLFVRHYHLLDSYIPRERIHWDVLSQVVKGTVQNASYDSWYLPWLAAVVTLPLGRNIRRSTFPLLVAIGVVAYTVFFYLHTPEPQFWIGSSASRVLLTVLMALVVAAASAHANVPQLPGTSATHE